MLFMTSSLRLPQCLIRLIWYVRWEIGCRPTTILWSGAFRISSKQHVAFLACSHQASSLRVSLAPMWCISTVVWTQPQLGRTQSILLFIHNYRRTDGFFSKGHLQKSKRKQPCPGFENQFALCRNLLG